jgi:hypothetical protein
MEGWRDGGMEGWRDGGMEGWRDGGMEGWRDGGTGVAVFDILVDGTLIGGEILATHAPRKRVRNREEPGKREEELKEEGK